MLVFVVLEGEFQLANGLIDGFDRVHPMTTEIMRGVLQVCFSVAQSGKRGADLRMRLSRFWRWHVGRSTCCGICPLDWVTLVEPWQRLAASALA